MRTLQFLTQRYLQKRSEIVIPPVKKGRYEWIISRALCHYRLFSLADIPIARRDSVLSLKIRQWCPFSDYGQYIVWRNTVAQVWVWNKARQQQALSETDIKSARILPETVLRPRPVEEGIQIIQCFEGVEVQFWKTGQLHGSRWFENMPSPGEWIIFQRAYGLIVHPDMPPIIDSPLLSKAWGKPKTGLSLLNLRNERLWVFLGVAIFISVFTWQKVQLSKWQNAVADIQSQIDLLQEKAYPVLNSRNQAIADKQRVKTLYALNNYPSQLEIMSTVTDILTTLPQQPHFTEWHYQLGSVQFVFETTGEISNLSDYVQKFQAVPFFRDVKPPVQGYKKNLFTMTMTIIPNPLK